MSNKIVGNFYHIRKQIGSGSFGTIYEGEDIRDGTKVAIKLEPLNSSYPQLNFESKLYTLFSGFFQVPKMHLFTKDSKDNIMVMDLLGPSLEDLFNLCGQQFTIKTVLMLTDQMINAVQFIHQKSFIHNDIKPDNFIMGLGSNKNQVYIIDFGLSKKYRDPTSHKHLPYEEGRSLTGTPRYASINALSGIRQSRRDDMESLGYVWLYLLRGSLPWMGINARNTDQKYAMIMEAKAGITPENLCAGFPREFVEYFKDVRNLKYDEEPHYTKYKQMFRDAFIRLGYKFDHNYDWLDSRGRLILQKAPKKFPIFVRQPPSPKKSESKAPQPTKLQMYKKISEESKRYEEIPTYTSEDDENRTGETPTLMSEDSDAPATYEAVASDDHKPKLRTFDGSSDSENNSDSILKVIPYQFEGTTDEWKKEEKYTPRRAPFKVPKTDQTVPRWMIPRNNYM